MGWFLDICASSWTMLVLAAPFILFGLLAAGLIHVLLPESLVLRFMGTPGLLGVVRAALIGVPLPVCSCGVVPITVELRRKGASRPAAQSFLITTPESSIDSIFLTWGMMGPVMAIARPVAAFFTAVLGGILSIASARNLGELTDGSDTRGERRPGVAPSAHAHDHSQGHDHCDGHHHSHDHGHDHSHSVAFAGSARARLALKQAIWGMRRNIESSKAGADGDLENKQVAKEDTGLVEETDQPSEASLWRDLLRPSLRYGFGELLDDLAFWLLAGVVLAGVLTAVLPDDLDALGLGTGLLPMLALLLVSIPLYMCASASTPIAAALMLKGLSPGAALVFLLAGPATNAATVLQLAATFGRRFVTIYVASVAAGALGCGILLDLLMADVDLTTSLRLSTEDGPGWITIAMGILLAILLARSLWRGAWAAGMDELRQAIGRVRAALPSGVRLRPRHLVVAGLLIALVGYGASGLRVVPAGSQGYGFIFGALTHGDLEPGLHYVPPAPFGHWETRRTSYPRKADVGFRTDLDMVEQRRMLVNRVSDEWHSPVAAMNTNPSQARYLTGDGALVELSFSAHYTLSDPHAFFYGIEQSRDFVSLYAQAAARALIASLALDQLLTERRAEVETRLRADLSAAMRQQSLGIEVLTVRIVDLHPPGDAVQAFRDVSSAKEDRETAIHRAREASAKRLPRGRGQAAQLLAQAEGEASRRKQEALGESQSFSAKSVPFGDHRELLGHLLWIESMERTLPGRKKMILPPDRGPSTTRGITLWRDTSPPLPIFSEDSP